MWQPDPRRSSPIFPEPTIDVGTTSFAAATTAPARIDGSGDAARGINPAPNARASLHLLGHPLTIQEAGCLALCGLWIALVHLRAAEVVPRLWPLW